MQPVKVKILDHVYLVKSDEEVETVLEIARYVDEKMREIKDRSGGLGDQKTAILAALDIASEYFQALRERDELLESIRHRTNALICHIDSMVG
jgi:cell division protein ZapA (FtsZ GTPase activity inhibitor)